MKNKKFKHILMELVFLAVVVGFLPELAVGAWNDLYGACGFSQDICNQIKLQSVYKAVGVVVCGMIAVVVSFLISEEFNPKE